MRTFNDAHREAILAGCPLSQISRRIVDKSRRQIGTEDVTVRVAGTVLVKDADGSLVAMPAMVDEIQKRAVWENKGRALVSVPLGPWRAALLALGWTSSTDGCEVEVERTPAYDSRPFERAAPSAEPSP